MTAWDTLRSIVTFGAYQRPVIEQRAAQFATSLVPTYAVNKPVWPDRTIETYSQEGYQKLALIFRLVGITATSVGAAPVRVYQEDDEGGLAPLPKHPMRLLMAQPNPQMRESRFLATIAMIASVSGFCLVEKERSTAGRVVALWPLRSDWAKPIPRTNAPPDWEYTIPGNRPITIPASELLHVTYADRPDGSPFGLGALEVALRETGLLNVMTDFLKAFFDSGAMPQVGLVPNEGLMSSNFKAEDVALLKETWRRRYGGLMNSVDPAILVGIKDIKRLSFDFNELAYTDLRDLSDLALCQAFGVPPGLVGTRIGLERNTFSNAAEMRRSFYEDTISTLWARIDDVLTLGLLTEFDASPNITLQFDASDIPALQEDRNARAGWLTQAYLGGGVSAHVYHSELGLPLPSADFYLRGFTQDAIPAADPLGLRQQPRAVVQTPALPATTSDEDEEPTEEDEARAIAIIREYRGRIGPAERRASIAVVNRRTIQRIADLAASWLRSFFVSQGSRIAPAAGTAVDWAQEERMLADVIERIYDTSGRMAYDGINTQFGATIDWNLANPNLTDVRNLLAQRVTGMTDESRTAIQDIITKGLQEGTSIDQLTETLRTTFDSWSDSRAQTVARTESAYAYNRASVVGYRESGVVDRCQLFDNSSHDTDPEPPTYTTCADRDGMIVSLDEVDRYTDSMHPNCIMAVAGVLIGES